MNKFDRTLNALQQTRAVFDQTENSKVKYTCNYGGLIGSDTISTSTWTVTQGSATVSDEANTTTQATCKVTGNAGTIRLINKIVTAAGDTRERIFDITIKHNDTNFTRLQDYGLY